MPQRYRHPEGRPMSAQTLSILVLCATFLHANCIPIYTGALGVFS
jgi:hypothetical protein